MSAAGESLAVSNAEVAAAEAGLFIRASGRDERGEWVRFERAAGEERWDAFWGAFAALAGYPPSPGELTTGDRVKEVRV